MFGISKFEAINEVNSSSSLAPDKMDKYSTNNDTYYCKTRSTNCIFTKENTLTLLFLNDSLSGMVWIVHYSPSKYSMCVSNMNMIADEFKKKYFVSPFKQYGDTGMAVETGGGFHFYLHQSDLFPVISVGIEIIYKYNPTTQKPTNEIYEYELTIDKHEY